MNRSANEGNAALRRGSGHGSRRETADILLAPLRTVRRLHAMVAPARACDRRGELPLSAAQKRIWVFSQLSPELPIFNTFRAYRVKGPLRVELLAQCLGEIAARHEILRTTYPEIDGSPRPAIAAEADIRVEIHDAGDLSSTAADTALGDYCNRRISRPIDPAGGPIFRAEVVKLAADEHLLIMVSHQIAFDGASWSILNREFTALYQAWCSNTAPALKPVPLQFLDFAAWQREFLRAEPARLLSSYWRQQLAGSLPDTGLPTRSDSPARIYNEGHSLPFVVPADLTGALKALGKREGVTLFVVLLAAFNLLLREFAQRNDLIVFTSVPCRTRSEFRNVIGLFSNFIPLRTRLAGNPTLPELLLDVQTVYSEALGHQDLPFELITRELQSGRGMLDESLLQTLFVFENAARKALGFDGCELTPVALKSGFTKFDITLFMAEEGGELTGSLRYKPAKFEPAMIERMTRGLVEMLRAVAARPGGRVEDFHCLSGSERDALLHSKRKTANNSAQPPARGASPTRVSGGIPATGMEALVASVWEEVLGVEEIGIHDNFFDLGGNSLLLITLIGRLQNKLQRDISVIEIFRDPTVSTFVRRLEARGGDSPAYEHIHERAAKKRRAAMNRRKHRGRKG